MKVWKKVAESMEKSGGDESEENFKGSLVAMPRGKRCINGMHLGNKNLYERAKIWVKTMGEDSEHFLVEMKLH
ncbi:hypothetical protein H5410_052205 [Solanum commersonii]|uniref:Uncharacterized protein n=1 Tax=Solanum commersonii TaxID=4109 RepID=A0A9J5X0S8_SOLCO|nr:hypothetical protein H5410_052205 [Solanum commersonii]